MLIGIEFFKKLHIMFGRLNQILYFNIFAHRRPFNTINGCLGFIMYDFYIEAIIAVLGRTSIIILIISHAVINIVSLPITPDIIEVSDQIHRSFLDVTREPVSHESQIKRESSRHGAISLPKSEPAIT
jgi:hypothetical protein